jgi:hypothetical protein
MKGRGGCTYFIDVTSECQDVDFKILFCYYFQCGWISPRPHPSVHEPLLPVVPDKVSRQYNSIPGSAEKKKKTFSVIYLIYLPRNCIFPHNTVSTFREALLIQSLKLS